MSETDWRTDLDSQFREACHPEHPLDVNEIRRIVTIALQVHWSNPAHHGSAIGNGALGCLSWDPEDPDGLVIRPTHTGYDEEEPLAGIYVGTPMGVRFNKKVVDNYGAKSYDNSVDYEILEASCPEVRLTHLNRDADVALAMATSSAIFCTALRAILLNHSDVRGVEIIGHGDATRIDAAPSRWFRVDLSLRIDFNYKSLLVIESHRLNRIYPNLTPAIN